MDFALRLDEASFKTPLELYKKTLKDTSKLHEKQAAQLDKALEDPKAALELLRAYRDRLALKIAFEEDYISRLESRVQRHTHLQNILNGSETLYKSSCDPENVLVKYIRPDTVSLDNSAALNSWYAETVNIHIAYYLLKTCDFNDAPIDLLTKPVDFLDLSNNLNEVSEYIQSHPALLFLSSFDIAKYVDFELVLRCNLISKDILQNNNENELLGTWIRENERFLKKTQSSLKMEFLLCTFAQIVRESASSNTENCVQALQFAKTELYALSKEEHSKYLGELKTAMGILALPSAVVLLFVQYEEYLEKNYFRQKCALESRSLVYFTESRHTNFVLVPEKHLLAHFLALVDASRSAKETFRQCLMNRNLHSHFQLLLTSRLNKLNALFVRTFQEQYGLLTPVESFETLLSLGISVLKTRECLTTKDLKKVGHSYVEKLSMGISKEDTKPPENKEEKLSLVAQSNRRFRERLLDKKASHCAICSSVQLVKLSKGLLFLHHTTSDLPYQHPVVLPNNNIYDRESLAQFNTMVKSIFEMHFDGELDPDDGKLLQSLADEYPDFYDQFSSSLLHSREFSKLVDPLTSEVFEASECTKTVFPT